MSARVSLVAVCALAALSPGAFADSASADPAIADPAGADPAGVRASGTSAPRERVDAFPRKDAGDARLALELELGFEPAGDSARASGSLRLSAGAARGFLAAIEYPASVALGGGAPVPELRGPSLELGWADRAGRFGIEASVRLGLPPGASLGSRVGAGIASDPVAASAWISAGYPLPIDRAALAPTAFRAGLSLAHALNDAVSTALAAEAGAAARAGQPRGSRIFEGGAAMSVSVAIGEWRASASVSLAFPFALPRYSLGARRSLGRLPLARGAPGGAGHE